MFGLENRWLDYCLTAVAIVVAFAIAVAIGVHTTPPATLAEIMILTILISVGFMYLFYRY